MNNYEVVIKFLGEDKVDDKDVVNWGITFMKMFELHEGINTIDDIILRTAIILKF